MSATGAYRLQIHGNEVMENATFRKWLAEHGCRFDQHEREKRGEGRGRNAEVPLRIPLSGHSS
jgi:hypothetical protein